MFIVFMGLLGKGKKKLFLMDENKPIGVDRFAIVVFAAVCLFGGYKSL